MIDTVRLIAAVPIEGGASGKTEGVRPVATVQNETPSRTPASLSRLLSLAAQLTQAPPPVDYARIAQIRRAIADGSYKVDPDALAKSIVAFAADRD